MCGLCSCTLTPAPSFHLHVVPRHAGPVASVHPRGCQAVPSASMRSTAPLQHRLTARRGGCLVAASDWLGQRIACASLAATPPLPRASVVQYCRHCRRMGGGWLGGSAAAPARAVVGPNNERAQPGGVALVDGSKATIAVSGGGGSGRWASRHRAGQRQPLRIAGRPAFLSLCGAQQLQTVQTPQHMCGSGSGRMGAGLESVPAGPQRHCFTGCI